MNSPRASARVSAGPRTSSPAAVCELSSNNIEFFARDTSNNLQEAGVIVAS